MATEIGVIKAIIGTATATSADGSVRNLQVGDKVFQNDLITTGAAGAIEIEFLDGTTMDMGRSSQAVLDLDMFDPSAPVTETAETTDVPDDVAALQEALLAGEDVSQLGEATAAGAGADGGGNEGGSSFVVRDYLNPEVTPDNGFDTTGPSVAFENPEELNLIVVDEEEPVVELTPPVDFDLDVVAGFSRDLPFDFGESAFFFPVKDSSSLSDGPGEFAFIQQPVSRFEGGFLYEFEVGQENDPADNIRGTDLEDGVTTAFTITSLAVNGSGEPSGSLFIDRGDDGVIDEVYGPGQPLPVGGLLIESGDSVYYYQPAQYNFGDESQQPRLIQPEPVSFTYFTTDSDGLVSDGAIVNIGFPSIPSPSASVVAGEEGNVVLEDSSIAVTISAEAGDPTDELTGVAVTLPDGWSATDGVDTFTGTFTLPASGQSFSQVLTVTPGPEDTDVDGQITAVASARDILSPELQVESDPVGDMVIIDTVLDDAVDVADGVNSGDESADVQVLSLNLAGSVVNPYGQTDGAPADATESGTATVTTTLPTGAVLGTLDGVTFTPTATTFTGTASEVAAWVDSLAVQVPAGFDGDITGDISVTFTDVATADGNPNTANDTYTDTATFSVSVAPGQVNPTAAVETANEGNVVLEDGSIAVTISAEAGDPTDELTGVAVTLPDGWSATDGVDTFTGTFTLTASGQSFSQVLTVTPGPEDTDVDGQITAVASARDITDNSVTADSAPASAKVVVDTVLDDAVDVADGVNSGDESADVQVLSLNLAGSVVNPYGQTDGAPADATESGTATVTTTLPTGAVLGTLDGVTFTPTATTFTGTASEVAAWVDSLAVQVPAGFDGDITGDISVTFTDVATADGNPNTANDTYTDTATFSVSVAPGQVNPTAAVETANEGNVVLEDGSIAVTISAEAGDPTDELTGVAVTLPDGWSATDGVDTFTGTFTLTASGQSFSQVLTVTPGPEDTDVDGQITAVASARDITDNSVTADSAPASAKVVVDTVLDDAVDVADGVNSGDESAEVQVLSLNLAGSVVNPYGQTDGAPADATESGTATVTTTLPTGAVLGTLDGVTFTPTATTFTGTASEVAAWVDSLAVQVPAGFDGDITGDISVTFTDVATADGNPNTANDTYTDTATFSVSVAPGQVNPTAAVETANEGNVVLEDGSIAVTISAEAGDPTDELTGVAVTLPDGWSATDGVDTFTGTFTLTASGQSFSQVLTVTPGPEDTDVDGQITAVASARDITDNSVTADSAPASAKVVVDTVLDDAVDVADGVNSGDESAEVQVLSLNLAGSVVNPYGQTDGAPADATESGTATVTTTLPTGAVLGTLDGVTFTPTATAFTGTASEVAAWVDSLAVQVPAGFDGDITGDISVTFTDVATADGNPNTANDTYTDTATFSVSIADSLPTNPANDSIVVEEESIPGLNGNDESDGLSYTVTGTFADNADWGVDGFGGVVSVNGTTAVDGTITVSTSIYSLVVNATTGQYTFTLLSNIASTPFGDNAEGTDDLPVFNVIAQDGDGSQIGFGLEVGVVDDIPTSLNPTTAHLKDQATSPDVVQLLNFAAGADGVGSVKFNTSLQGQAAVDSEARELSFNGTGQPLFINYSADGTQLQFVTKNADGTLNTADVKFFIQLSADGQTYTVSSEGIISNGTAISSATVETVGGGNKAWKAFINLGGTQEDALLTTKTGDSVNTNNAEIGVSDGNSFKVGEGLRIDLLNGVTTSGSGGGETFAVAGPHNLTNSFRQIVSTVQGGSNNTANITVTAIVANDFDFGAGNDAASHEFFYNDLNDVKVDLSISDISVYNQLGQPVTTGIDLFDNGYSITIRGLKEGWSFEINSTTEFNAVQIEAADSVPGFTATNFKLGVFSYGEDSDGLPIELDYDIVGTDTDGDSVTGSLGVNLYPAGSTIEGNDLANTLNGTANDDYLLGRGGDDILSGGNGNDLLIGGSGNDTLTGGAGSDTFLFSLAANSGNDTITDFVPGTDKLSFIDVIDANDNGSIDFGDAVSSFENGGAGNDLTLNLTNGGSVTLKGLGTADSITDLQTYLGGASNVTVDQS